MNQPELPLGPHRAFSKSCLRLVALGTGCACGSTGGSQGKGVLPFLTHSTSHSATTPCAPEPLPHVTWVGREVCEKNGNQRCSALSFACVVVEKGRTGYFLVSSMASSPFWKEAAQALCCPGLPRTGCGTARSFSLCSESSKT